jgi:hypothetical protein
MGSYTPADDAYPLLPKSAKEGAGRTVEGPGWDVAVRRTVRGVDRGSMDRNMTQQVWDQVDYTKSTKSQARPSAVNKHEENEAIEKAEVAWRGKELFVGQTESSLAGLKFDVGSEAKAQPYCRIPLPVYFTRHLTNQPPSIPSDSTTHSGRNYRIASGLVKLQTVGSTESTSRDSTGKGQYYIRSDRSVIQGTFHHVYQVLFCLC